MQKALKGIFFIMPLLFGIGFLAPLTAEAMTRLHVTGPFGIAPIAFGLALGALWGLYATWKGSWL